MNKLKAIRIFFLLLSVSIVSIMVYNAGNHNVNNKYKEYYHKTEALLDSIYNANEDWFMDVIQETDVYYEYEVARDNLM